MLARHQGQVVLVWGAIPGERVRARIDRVGKGVLYAETIDVLSASPDRRPSRADWRCGGDVLAHIEYTRQVRLKGQIIQDAFGRIGRVPLAAAPEVMASPEAGYRMRARLHVQDGRLGFYREGTHQLCDAAATAQLRPSTNEWLAHAAEILRRTASSGVAALEVAENVAGDQRACHLELYRDSEPMRFAELADGLTGLSAQRIDDRDVATVAGEPVVEDVIAVAGSGAARHLTLRRNVRAFFQSNRFLLEPLVRHVVALVPAGPVVDLYAGVGLFGLSLAAAGADSVTLIEGDPISGADLKRNAEGFGGVRVKRRSVEEFLTDVRRPLDSATFVVDPPRTGLSREAMAGLIRVRPSTIVYVSCDVATLARDTRALLDAGYTLGGIQGFDLFPNTAHVETVAVLSPAT